MYQFRSFDFNFSGTTVGEHPLEVLPAVSGAGLGFVGVNAHILPAVMVADVGAVMIHLGRQGVEHGVLAAGHSGVCCHPDGLGHTGCKLDEVLDNLYSLSDSPVMLAELMELLQYKYDLIDFIDAPVDLGFDCPLDLHCTYTRDQLLVALDFMNPNSVREGVKWLPDKQVDVLFVTLNKSDKEYSPTTMYNDYSINEELFHWQSQSTTTDTGSVGQRYIHHRERGSKVLLFVREFKSDLVGAAPYTFLGTANYVKHTGSRPMNITWKLDHPILDKFREYEDTFSFKLLQCLVSNLARKICYFGEDILLF